MGRVAMATVQSDIFKPSKYGGKYTVTLIPGAQTSYQKTISNQDHILKSLYR